jgi:hypothetical protein
MKDHVNCIRGFHWSTKAWNGKSVFDRSISFGMYQPGDGTSGEMTMVWHDLGRKIVPKLECFDDGWNALSLFDDLIKKLGEHDDENITEDQFVSILLECGFTDMTAYKQE